MRMSARPCSEICAVVVAADPAAADLVAADLVAADPVAADLVAADLVAGAGIVRLLLHKAPTEVESRVAKILQRTGPLEGFSGAAALSACLLSQSQSDGAPR